jgi:hypothetical protein
VRIQTISMAWKTALFISAGRSIRVPYNALSRASAKLRLPQSIEAMFTGRHETFQYTKYSQVAKRLRCAKLIPPGLVAHAGRHNHSLDQKVVHFCRAKCDHWLLLYIAARTASRTTFSGDGLVLRTLILGRSKQISPSVTRCVVAPSTLLRPEMLLSHPIALCLCFTRRWILTMPKSA